MNVFISDKDYEIAEANGICKSTLIGRVRKLKWSIDKARSYPVDANRHFIKMIRENYPDVLELCEKNGVCYETFRTRVLRQKWDIYKAATTPVDVRFKAKNVS